MEGYTRHSRSHYRAPPPPPSKKGFGNGAAIAGANGFMAYDDVFCGPPKFGATPFAPRAEDYSEIFGSFLSSRSSSIPMLDLPPVDDSVAAFEVRGCSGVEYSDIFGGFDFGDFAASYDELFRRSDGSEESSDDAWTPVGTESPSGESDPYASSERNKYFLNGDFHETLEDKVFDLSYHSFNLGTAEDLELTHEAQLSSVPGYTFEVEGSDMREKDEERYSSGVADDIILCEDFSGNISVEKPWKTASIQSHSSVVKESNEYGEKAGGVDGISLSPRFVFSSDVSPRAESSHLPPISGLPRAIIDRKKDAASSTSDFKKSKSNTIETIFGGGSLDFFDVEVNTSSSSIASAAAAIKEAMDRAKVKINSAKELRKRKKDSVKDMPFTKIDMNSDGKVTMVFDETISRVDELHIAIERESNVGKTSGDNVQYSSKASQVFPDPLQSEDAVDIAAESAQRKIAKNQSSSLDPVVTEEGDGEWKVTRECYELLNNDNTKVETSLLDNIKKPAQEIKTMHVKKLEQNVVGIDAFIKDYEDSESADEACNPRENRRRLRASKAASRNAFHEKMVKLAQDVHETVVSSPVETVKSGKEGLEEDGAKQNPEIQLVEEKNERRFDQADDQVYYDRKHNDDFYLAGSELSSEEDFIQADFDKKGKEACRLKENEKRGTEVAARGETLKKVEEFARRGDNGREFDEAHQDEEKEEPCVRKGAEAMKKVLSPRDENLSVLNEALEQKEGKGKFGRNEKQESDVRLKKAHAENNERENKVCENVACQTDKCEENAAMSDCYEKKPKESVDSLNFEKHYVATGNISEENINEADVYEEMEEPEQTNNEIEKSKMDECWAIKEEEQMMKSKGDLQPELKIPDQDSNQERNVHIESEYFISAGPSTLDEVVTEKAHEHEEFESSNLSSSPDEEVIKSSDVTCEREESHAADEDMPINEEKASQPMTSERKESVQKQYLSSHANQRVGKEAKAINGDLAAEDREVPEKLKRKEDSDRERLRELQLEKERERERELEAKRLRILEEEREKERVNELEKLRLRRQEELREREREKDNLRKLEEERQREREKDLEKERLRKLEEEWEREREREKDRMGVELKMSAVERATAEARQRAMAEARERLEKACAEAREKSLGKFSKEFQLRSVSEKFSSFKDVGLRHCQSSNDLWNSDKSDGVEGETAQRFQARLERHRRTVDRVAKALAEKNMRDLIAQREQAERNRFAETLDADIKRWSNGKEGNLRALLSTLQYILGPDSGWQSIPLTDVITSAAVKKAYRKATLCVHPDKLQQRGATIQQKYICEKVFDLLKDAWNSFNSEER